MKLTTKHLLQIANDLEKNHHHYYYYQNRLYQFHVSHFFFEPEPENDTLGRYTTYTFKAETPFRWVCKDENFIVEVR